VTSAALNGYGNNSSNMHLKNYRDDLLKRLRDPKYAAE